MDQHHWRSGAMVFIVKLDRSGVFLPDLIKLLTESLLLSG